MKRIIAFMLTAAILLTVSGCEKHSTSSEPASASSKPPTSNVASRPVSSDESSEKDTSSSASSSPSHSSTPGEIHTPPSEPNETHSIHEKHFCYSTLTDIQKGYYEKLYDAVIAQQASWIVLGPASDNYKNDIAIVRNAVSFDHPDIFWLPSYYAAATAISTENEKTAVIYFSNAPDGNPSYLVSRSEAERMAKKLNEAVEKIAEQITSDDPYEIELQLHDILCKNTVYTDAPNDPMIYTAYGAIVNGKALCEGYSRAMQLLLNRMGIDSVVVTGSAGGVGHMWNLVEIHGAWYHLDVSWDDLGDNISHGYFNLSDDMILHDHTFSKSIGEILPEEIAAGNLSFNIFRPICNNIHYNYFNKSGYIFFINNIPDLASYIVSQKSDVTEVRFSDYDLKNKFSANPDKFVADINKSISANFPESKFTVGGVSVSSWVLRLYRKEKGG